MRVRESTGPVIILGAGPAGLSAAYELSAKGVPCAILEQDSVVGGLARTVEYKGYRFDIGGHRFFTKLPLVEKIWKDVLGDDLLVRPRLSRTHSWDSVPRSHCDVWLALCAHAWLRRGRKMILKHGSQIVLAVDCLKHFSKATPKKCGGFPAAKSALNGEASEFADCLSPRCCGIRSPETAGMDGHPRHWFGSFTILGSAPA